jgi:hypothetical protein
MDPVVPVGGAAAVAGGGAAIGGPASRWWRGSNAIAGRAARGRRPGDGVSRALHGEGRGPARRWWRSWRSIARTTGLSWRRRRRCGCCSRAEARQRGQLPELLDVFQGGAGQAGVVLGVDRGLRRGGAARALPWGLPPEHVIWIGRRLLSVVGHRAQIGGAAREHRAGAYHRPAARSSCVADRLVLLRDRAGAHAAGVSGVQPRLQRARGGTRRSRRCRRRTCTRWGAVCCSCWRAGTWR